MTSDNLIQSIKKNPTFDLVNLTVIDKKDSKLFLETKEAIFFDGVYAKICLRSRACRPNTKQSKIIDNYYSAIIDAGFIGKLVFSVKLTKLSDQYSDSDLLEILSSSFSLMLFESQAKNYYTGSNQTTLEPTIIFNSN